MANLLNYIAEPLSQSDSALARLWHLGPGDLCASCPMAPECRDRTECLHLVDSLGLSSRTDGPFRRFPVGARQVGRVVTERRPFLASQGLDRLGLADPLWLSRHGIQSFAAIPIMAGRVCRGVLGVFSTRRLEEADIRALTDAARQLQRRSGPAATSVDAFVPRTLAEIEREAIERTLEFTRGRVSGPRGAAPLLGIKPTTLHSRMRKLGVRRPGP